PRVVGASVDTGAHEGAVAVASEPGPEGEEGLGLSVQPNPARRSASVVLTLPEPGEVSISLYDVLGRRVAVLHDGRLAAGEHALPLDVRGLPPGVYVVRVSSGYEIATRPLTLLR